MIDLGKWASGDYRIAGEPVKTESDDDANGGNEDVD